MRAAIHVLLLIAIAFGVAWQLSPESFELPAWWVGL